MTESYSLFDEQSSAIAPRQPSKGPRHLNEDRPEKDEMEQQLARLQAEIEEYRRRSGELRLALETLTTLDYITGARNRAGIIQSIEGAIQWSSRENTSFGVMGVKIDGLTEIVKTEPPEMAEEAMAHTAAVISAGLRAVDRVGRVDDALFLIVLAKLEESGVAVVSRRIASILSAVPFQTEHDHYSLDPRIACVLVEGGATPPAEEIVRSLETAEGSATPDTPELIFFPTRP